MAAVPSLPLSGFTRTPTPTAVSVPASTPHASELRINFKKIKSEGISHHFPTLVGLRIEGKEGDNPSVLELADELRAEGQTVTTFPVEWRNKSPEELSQALFPMLLHYRMQALFLRERTRRRAVENEELTMWSNLHVVFQYKTPLKLKLMAHRTKALLERQRHETGSRLRSAQASQLVSEDSYPLPGECPAADSICSPHMGDSNGSTRPASPPPRIHLSTDLQDSIGSFEKTLTRILESTQPAGSAHLSSSLR